MTIGVIILRTELSDMIDLSITSVVANIRNYHGLLISFPFATYQYVGFCLIIILTR